MIEFVRYMKKKAMRALLSPMKLLRVKNNKVLLIDELSRKYAGNPKAISEYLNDQYRRDIDVVYSVGDESKYAHLRERGIVPVTMNSFGYFYHAMTSRVLVTNSGGLSYIPLRKSQFVINTHHGGGAYKKVGTDMFGNNRYFRKDLMLSSKQINLFLSTNKRFTEALSRSCLIPKEVFWEIGMPRSDRLIHGDEKDKREIREKIGLKEGQRLVLYAPTYRKPSDDYFKGSIAINYNIDSKAVCDALRQRFGVEWVFAYRLHPCVENKQDYILDGALDLSGYEDMQDLLVVTDVMINDFSSSLWDFLLTGRPCFMYAPDMEHYIETTEVYTPVGEWPFPKSHNNEELIQSILDFDEAQYRRDCERHYTDLGGCETGRATELVCKKIAEVCHSKT